MLSNECLRFNNKNSFIFIITVYTCVYIGIGINKLIFKKYIENYFIWLPMAAFNVYVQYPNETLKKFYLLLVYIFPRQVYLNLLNIYHMPIQTYKRNLDWQLN